MIDPSHQTTAPSRSEYAGRLADAIEARLDEQALPAHVVYRLATLLYPQPWVFIDADATEDSSTSKLTGRVVVYTDRALALLTFNGVVDIKWVRPGAGRVDHNDATVEVTMVARRRLNGVMLNGEKNGNEAWQQAATDHAVFSKHSKITLQYDDTPQALDLPLTRAAAEDMGPLLEGLIRDLAD